MMALSVPPITGAGGPLAAGDAELPPLLLLPQPASSEPAAEAEKPKTEARSHMPFVDLLDEMVCVISAVLFVGHVRDSP
jgi:hypothetical protein